MLKMNPSETQASHPFSIPMRSEVVHAAGQGIRCSTCGARMSFVRQGQQLCPACLLQSVRRPKVPATAENTGAFLQLTESVTWTDAFPQFELVRELRRSTDGAAYLMDVACCAERSQVVLQLLTGPLLTAAGGPGELIAPVNRMAKLHLAGLATIVEAGDLTDAFYLVTEVPKGAVILLADEILGCFGHESFFDHVLRHTERLVEAARERGIPLRLDPFTLWVKRPNQPTPFSGQDSEGAGFEVFLAPDLRCLAQSLANARENHREEPTVAASLLVEELNPGDEVGGGDFLLEERVGEGGFGEVWRAQQKRPVQRMVALKLMKEGLRSPRTLARFEIEQQALARLDHPHTARFFAGGVAADRRPFFAMEWVEGESLTTFCEREALRTRQRVVLFLQVCEAVQHAHQKGILHRDLKASNVMVTSQSSAPCVKVIDFGIARALEEPLVEGVMLTRSEDIVGTPASMSPEQAMGTGGGDLDVRTDVYGLGVLLYQLLTGTLPFDPRLPADELRRRIREDEPRRPSACARCGEAARLLKGDLDWIILKCLEKNPDYRYASVSALARDLKFYLADEPVSVVSPKWTYRFSKWARRHGRWIALGAGVFVLMLLATFFSSWQAIRAFDAEARASESLVELKRAYIGLNNANEVTEKAMSQARTLLVRTLLEKGTRQFNAGEVVGLMTLAEAVAAAEDDDALQRQAMELWTLARLWLPGAVHAVFDHPYAVALSPDGSTAGWCNAEGLHFYETATGRQESISLDPRIGDLQSHPMRDHFDRMGLVFSPSGRRIALHNPQTGVARVWDVGDRSPLTGLLCHPRSNSIVDLRCLLGWTKVSFHPAEDRLATVAANGTVCLWDLENGHLATSPWVLESPTQYNHVAFTPGGKALLISTRFDLVIVDLTATDFPAERMEISSGINELLMASDSKLVAAHFPEVRVWDLETGSPSAEYGPPWAEQFHLFDDLCLSPDGRRLLCGTRRGEGILFSIDNINKIEAVFEHGGGGVRSLGFSSDGQMIATGGLDGVVKLWDVEAPARSRATWPQPGTIDQIVTGSVHTGLFISKSRTRDESQPAYAVLRSFPQPMDQPAGRIPRDWILHDVDPTGHRFLICSEDKKELLVFDDLSGEKARLPRFETTDHFISSSKFLRQRPQVAVNVISPGMDAVWRWDYVKNSPPLFRWSTQLSRARTPASQSAVIGMDLPGPEQPLVILPKNWRVDIMSLSTGREIHSVKLGNQPSGVAIASKLGWYGVGDKSGFFRRFRISDHEEVLPRIEVGERMVSAASSGDNDWLITVDENVDGGRILKAWFVGGPLRPFSLRVPGAHDGGEVFAVGEREFVFQRGEEIRRFAIPRVTGTSDEIDLRTKVALGVARGESGELRLLPAEQFRGMQSRVRSEW